MARTRYAKVPQHNGRPTAQTVAAYLPANYHLAGYQPADAVLIEGEDNAGWTLDDYVIPRLGSGLIYCEEIRP